MATAQPEGNLPADKPPPRRPSSALPARPKSAMSSVQRGVEYNKRAARGGGPEDQAPVRLTRPASALARQRPASALGGSRDGSRLRPASAMDRGRVPRHMEALRASATTPSAIDQALGVVKYEQKFYNFTDPADLPTPKWIPALTATDFTSRARQGGGKIIPRKDITMAEGSLAASSGGVLQPSRSVSPSRRNASSLTRVPSLGQAPSSGARTGGGGDGGRDRGGVRGLWTPAAGKLLTQIFDAKCVDLKLKPLKQRRDRFLHTVRTQSTHEMVCLKDAGLGSLAGAAVAAMLKSHRCSELDLCGNLLRDQGISALSEVLGQNCSLTKLDLRANDIGIEGAAALFGALKDNSTLTELDIGMPPVGGGNRNRMGLKSAKQLSKTIAVNRTLCTLNLSGNGMGADSCAEFAKGLTQNTSLRRLDVSLNQLEDDGTESFCNALEGGGCLEQVVLTGNNISNKGAIRIALSIQKCEILLQSLDLSQNKIGPKASTALGHALSCNSLLSTLHLGDNEMGPDGCIGLAQGLVSQNLTELSLSKNSVGDQGCAAVAKVLGSSPSIKRLDLSSNSIGDVGGAAMAKALVAHSTLTSLSLENNCMGDHAGVGIAQALSRNNVLLSLSLKANLVHDSTGSALVVGLQSNQTLTELDVSWNDINYTNHQSLEALIQEQANRYRDASVARLKLELERLRRMEPFLAIREAELSDVTAQLKDIKLETQRVAEERDETIKMTAYKMEELEQQTKEGNANFEEIKAELNTAEQTLAEEKKRQELAITAAKKRLNLAGDEVFQLRRKVESIEKERQEEVADLEEIEAHHRDLMQALAEKKEQLRREIQQMKNLIEKGLDYKPRSFGDLHVTVMEARDLPQKSKFDKNDPYCIVWLQGTEYKFQTKTALDAGQHAVFNESVTWQDIEEDYTTLKVEVWEDDELKDDELMGKGVLDLKHIYKKAKKRIERIKKRAAGGDDGLIDLKELAAWMTVNHAERILQLTPEEVLARYDHDGSGQLDEEEMQEIKNWVESERLAQEAKKEQQGDGEGEAAPEDHDFEGKDETHKIALAKKGAKHQSFVRLRISLKIHEEEPSDKKRDLEAAKAIAAGKT